MLPIGTKLGAWSELSLYIEPPSDFFQVKLRHRATGGTIKAFLLQHTFVFSDINLLDERTVIARECTANQFELAVI